jgi:outer membrane protein assembly factor BamB
MSSVTRSGWAFAFALLLLVSAATAQDWPQWRGPNRDAKAGNFNAPQTWPAELTQKWKVAVGDGVSTPAVVGDRIFVHARQGEDEIVRCLNADTGEEIWKKISMRPSRRADRHPGSPARGARPPWLPER